MKETYEHIQMKEINASNIAKIGYEDGVLKYELCDGSQYVYLNVDSFHYRNMLESHSIGGYIHRKLKDNFKYMKVRHARNSLQAKAERLVNQIELGDYTDELGHSLKMNVAFIELRGMVQNG